MAGQLKRRGSVEQLPSRRFRAVVHARTDPLTGKRRKVTATKSEAERLLARLQNHMYESQHPKSAARRQRTAHPKPHRWRRA